MKLRAINETKLSDVGHTTLDVAGLVPGIGEVADLTNALWYAKNGQYLESLLSIISLVPEIGDVIGKGAKYFSKSGSRMERFLSKHGEDIAKWWGKIHPRLKKAKEWQPYLEGLNRIVSNLKYDDGPDQAGPSSAKTV